MLFFLTIQLAANAIVSWRRRAEDEIRQSSKALLDKMVEQRNTQEALRQTQDDLARVARVIMVGELAASIAHEVNQPLAAVVANSDACLAWLSAPSPNLDEARVAAKQAGDGAILASEVISRIRSLISNEPAERLRVQVNEIIRETVTLMTDQAAQSQVHIEATLDPTLPPVIADKIQLQQVVINLVTNAIAAMAQVADRPRELGISTHRDSPGLVAVTVTDSGIGLPEASLAKIFEPFYTTRAQGLGMGLAISRSIIESHGGKLWAESIHCSGSTFHIRLPLEV